MVLSSSTIDVIIAERVFQESGGWSGVAREEVNGSVRGKGRKEEVEKRESGGGNFQL